MLVGDILEKSAWVNPNKTAWVGEGIRLTFAESNERTNRVANSLLEMGLRKGDRIALLAKNSVQYMELYFAIAKLGGVAVPVNWRLNKDELIYILRDSGPKAIFYSEEFSTLVEGLKAEIASVAESIQIDGNTNTLSYDQLVERGSPKRLAIDLRVDDVAIQFYTGGTTARPKGVLWSHRGIHYNCLNVSLGWNLSANTVTLVVLPLFHQAGAHTIADTFMGSTCVILPEFAALKVLSTIEKERITRVIMVPTTIVMLIEHPDREKYDLSSLRSIQYGGAPMPVRPLKKALEVLNCGFSQSYGMTEAPILTRLSPDDHIVGDSPLKLKRLQSVGRPMPDVVGIRIVDDSDHELPQGAVGEIIAKAPCQMLGYWNLPEENEKTLCGGWVHTGDMGYFDEGGYLFLTERKKDIIISGGENISAKEVEEVLYEHPAVLECTVIGIPHDVWGEAVKAVVVLKNGAHAEESELLQHCRKKLAGFKCPKSVDFVNVLPKSTIGKILKRLVRERYW